MAMIDPKQESKRLAEFYAGQTDGELENVASQAYELTDAARETLRAELSKRGLYVGQLLETKSAEEDNLVFRDLVTVRKFWSLPDAELAKGVLDSAGIESFMFDENMGRMYLTNVIVGVRLQVDPENVEIATRLLDQSVPESAAEDTASDDPEASDPDPST
jgi:hypothetical protein